MKGGMARSWPTSLLLLLIVGQGHTLSLDRDVSMPGNLTLGALFSVQTNSGGSCGDLYVESIKLHQAVRWFLRTLNQQNYIPGVTLGLAAFKTCDDSSRAAKATLTLLKEHEDVPIYGLIGPGGSSETQTVSRLLSSLPADDRLLQLSYSATAATLSDKSIYKNLYRVIEADDVQVQVLHQLLLEMKWNYVAIVYEQTAYGTEGATALKRLAEKSDICIPIFYGIAADSASVERRREFVTLEDKLEKQSESPVVGMIFFGSGTTATTMFSYLNLELKNFQVIASEAISLNEDYMKSSVGAIFPRAKGLLTLSPPVYDPVSFKDHWTRLHSNKTYMLAEIRSNDWLLKYMESVTKCTLVGQVDVDAACVQKATSAASAGSVPIYTSYALMAVASVAKALKRLHSTLCGGTDGMCEQLKNVKRSRVIDEMKDIEINSASEFTDIFNFNFSFSFQNGEIKYKADEQVSTYSVYNYRSCDNNFCFAKVGDYIRQRLNLFGTVKSYDKNGVERSFPAAAQCQQGFVCSACTVSRKGGTIFIPGDLYLVGFAPIHDKSKSVLECGTFRTSPSVDLAEAIVYAVNRVNQKQEPFAKVLGDKRIGLVLMDTCSSAFLAREHVMKLHRGELQLTDGMNSSMIVDDIIGYIGPYSSSLNVALSSVMIELDKLAVSYGASSTRLSARKTYPNFMRTCSADHKQANVMMYVAKQLDSEYVQIIYSDEEYGQSAKVALELAARKYRICISQTIAVVDSSAKADFIGYVSELRRYRHARLVIIFVRSHMTPALMEAITDEMNSDEFVFIGAESWGKREPVIKDNPKLLGSITLTNELPINQRFADHFTGINVQQSSNPWLQEFIESRAQCYYPMSFNKGTKTLCIPNVIAQHRQADTWVPFAINGVYSLVLGFNAAVEEKCPGEYRMCPEYSTADLKKHVKMVRLDINSDDGKVRVFDDNGDGNVGYMLYQVVKEGTNYLYHKVGSSSEDGIDFQRSRLIKDNGFSSSCQNDMECGVCKLQFNETASGPQPTTNPAVVGLGAAVVTLFVVVVVLVVLGVVFRKRHMAQLAKNKDDIYLSVVPDPKPDPNDYFIATPETGQFANYPSSDSGRYDVPRMESDNSNSKEYSNGSNTSGIDVADGSEDYKHRTTLDVPTRGQNVYAAN